MKQFIIRFFVTLICTLLVMSLVVLWFYGADLLMDKSVWYIMAYMLVSIAVAFSLFLVLSTDM